jgi:SAM-dependent methyltransferase
VKDDQAPERVRAAYDAVAGEYAERFAHELEHKPLDRALLDRFASSVRAGGSVVELGCGTGHIAAYLAERDAVVRGIDLSDAAVAKARELFPHVAYETGDMLALSLPDDSLAGIASFYSICHFSSGQLLRAAREMSRVLEPGGWLLLAFHLGDEQLHVDEFLGRSVSLDFVLFPRAEVTAALEAAGFVDLDVTERDPYPDVEAQTRRAYVFARTSLDRASW